MSKIIPHLYCRVSTSHQLQGSGMDDQSRVVTEYVKSKPEVFDVSKMTLLKDEGLSAFSGEHLQGDGALRGFVDDVESGVIPSGSALIVYSLDRLSRLNPWVGSHLISTLISKGIEIHSVSENSVLKSDDPIGSIISGIYLLRANNESVLKSERAKDGYKARLQKSILNKTILTKQMPRWLFDDNGSYGVKKDMKEAIDYIFDSYIDGLSSGHIAKELNTKGLKNNNTSWTGSYVAKLIRDRRLIGEHIRLSAQIKGVKREIIEKIPEFYPVVVDKDRFYLANNMLDNVAKNIRGRTRLTYGDTSVLKNLFSGVIKCGLCNGMTTVVKNSKPVKLPDGSRKYVAGTTFIRCRTKYEYKSCKQGDVKYETIEKAILEHLMGLDIPALLAKPVDNKLDIWKSELNLCISDRNDYKRLIDERKALGKRASVESLEALQEVTDRIEELTSLIESHVDEDFVPVFDAIDLEQITDITNVKERGLIKKSINSLVEKITYKTVSGFVMLEFTYLYRSIKHVIIINKTESKVVVNFSVESRDDVVEFVCNQFMMRYYKYNNEFDVIGSSLIDYSHMVNFVDYLEDDVSRLAKEFLVKNMDRMVLL
ncbi:TPA: recombinase family protein [Klebsiella variicola subsp. variicola]|nr:recombinase family protein [Klebsiella variicola subsp. variicola]